MAKKRASSKTPGTLDPDDAELWRRIARTARPLKKDGGRVAARAATDTGEAPLPPAPKPGRNPVEKTRKQPPPPAPPPLGSFDRREAKGLGAGRLEIGARIDLHGMRQREAHGVLTAFLLRSHQKGYRHVLVITGKGAGRGADAAQRPFGSAGDTPGVLRRAVPQWLAGPALRAVVVSYAPAAPRHGGEGALYVRLRKPGK